MKSGDACLGCGGVVGGGGGSSCARSEVRRGLNAKLETRIAAGRKCAPQTRRRSRRRQSKAPSLGVNSESRSERLADLRSMTEPPVFIVPRRRWRTQVRQSCDCRAPCSPGCGRCPYRDGHRRPAVSLYHRREERRGAPAKRAEDSPYTSLHPWTHLTRRREHDKSWGRFDANADWDARGDMG